MARRQKMPDIVGMGEIAEILGVTDRRIRMLRQDDPTFPQPNVNLRMGPVWLRSEVDAWIKATAERRNLRRRKDHEATTTATS